MAIIAIRGAGINHYLKPGYNIVRRYMKGDTPDDEKDCFEPLGYSKSRKEADKKAKNLKGIIEIITYKEPKEDL
jgi:hypothetical protein